MNADTTASPRAVPAVTEKALDGTILPFVMNEGQIANDSVKYYVNTFAGSVFVTDSGLRYSVTKKTGGTTGRGPKNASLLTASVSDAATPTEGAVFDEQFLDSGGELISYAPEGETPSDVPVSFFQGSDPANWKREVRNYGGLSLGELWQGIDVSLKARGKNIEKIFTVQSGANPDEIVVGLDGIDGISLRDDGTLHIATALGDISMTAPLAYQLNDDGTKAMIAASYDIRSDKRYGFSIGEYDHAKPLVIDPLLAGTFLGSGGEEFYSMAIDTNGDVFVAGTTDASDFPVTVGAYQRTFGGGSEDFYISKFDSDFTHLLASTYLGGTGSSYYGTQIKLDSGHNIYMAASYSATDYPTIAGAYQRTCTIGSYQRCGVISKLSNDLTSLLASTYVGNNDSYGKGMAIDSNGRIYLVGTTSDAAFPTTAGAYNRVYTAKPNYDEAFVSRFDAGLTTLEASTFVGPANAFTIKIDSSGDVFIAGADASYLYPATPGAYDTSNPASDPLFSDTGDKYFISKLSRDLTQLTASTFFGGTSIWMYVEGPEMMQLDSSGNVYLSLDTGATDIPTTSGAYQETNQGEADLFISKFSNDLTSLLASTYLGGSGYEEHYGGFGIDANDNIFVSAYTPSQDYPTTPGSFQPSCPPENWGGVVVSKLTSDLATLSASTWIMLNSVDIMFPYALAFDSSGDVYVGGSISASSSLDIMVSDEFPTTPDAYQTSVTQKLYASNGAVAKFDNNLSGPITAPVITTGTIPANITATSATLSATLTSDGGEAPTVSIKWGTDSGSYPNTCAPVTNSGSVYSCDLSGLAAGTVYYFQASATNSAGTGSGSEVNFQTTTASPVITAPVITTGTIPANITATSATLDATLTDDGGEAPTVSIKWGTDSGSYPNTCAPVTNSGSVYSCDLSGLAAGAVYYFQASATNSAGTDNGSEVNFQTMTASPVITTPVIATGSATGITATSATLSATLTSDGGEMPTISIKWGTESGSYPNTCTPAANSGSAYSCELTSLIAGTTYYFRASATNSAGTENGSEVNFQTTATDVSPSDSSDSSDDSDDDRSLTDRECKPSGFSVKRQPDGGVKLSWKKPCSLIDTIGIERKLDEETFEKIATVRKNDRGYADAASGLSFGKYTYRIRGYRKAGGRYSEYSDKKSVIIERPAGVGMIERRESVLPSAVADAAPMSPETVTKDSRNPSDRPASYTNESVVTTWPDASESSVPRETVGAIERFVRTFAVGFTTLVFSGLMAGVVVVGSSTVIPLFAASPALLSEGAARILGAVGLIGKKKRKESWGVVFDSETRLPLRGVPVSIMNEDGRVVDVSVSDSHGHYGFLPNPGTYALRISRKGYELETTNRQDILYGETYVGQMIEVGGEGMERINIALRSTAIDWQDFARRKIASYTSAFSIVKRDALLVLFYTGAAVNAGIAYLLPTTPNIVLFVMYLGMLAYDVFFKKRAYGLVTNAGTGQPVPFTMLSVYDATDSKKRMAFAVSDVLGRYFMFVENGNYTLKASGNFLGGAHFEKAARITVKDGVVRNDLNV